MGIKNANVPWEVRSVVDLCHCDDTELGNHFSSIFDEIIDDDLRSADGVEVSEMRSRETLPRHVSQL